MISMKKVREWSLENLMNGKHLTGKFGLPLRIMWAENKNWSFPENQGLQIKIKIFVLSFQMALQADNFYLFKL